MFALAYLISAFLEAFLVLASPAQETFISNNQFYDVQAHRGGRGNTVESTLPSFAWGLVDGATTLELDNGITSDGEVVVWHDNQILAKKCMDTHPVVSCKTLSCFLFSSISAKFPDDPTYPYVGKFIANLTLAQIKTLDCGSTRQPDFPQQLLYPGARIPTLQEVFDFVECADPSHRIWWNIESKINPEHPNRTARVEDFVQKQHGIFSASPYYRSITVSLVIKKQASPDSGSQYQSFDWRTLIAMKEHDPLIPTSALIDEETAFMPDNNTSPWLGGLHLDSFPGPSLSQKMAQAARAINADILSPCGTCFVPSFVTFEDNLNFVTQVMVREAHALGLSVKPWTMNGLDRIDQLLRFGVDGIITDYPSVVRRWAKQQGFAVAPKYPKQRVFSCLEKHLKATRG
ncbi:PLC-like phosphodiesterase [Lanmaoa asiatica]|nr:PLC-like phosphodiesterase [Lanmaoa asiatica]